MTDEKFERLSASIGEEAAKLVVDQIGDNKEVLEELGVESKEDEAVAEEEVVEEEVVEEEVVEEAEAEEEADDEKGIKALAKAIIKELELDTLADMLHNQQARLEELETTAKELKVEEDEKVAGLIEDKSLGALLWRKSESEDTLVEDEEGKKIVEEQKPSWVSEVMS